MAGIPGYVWDTRMRGGRYRTVGENGRLGRLVSPSEIANNLRTLHERTAQQYARLASGVYSNKITVETFQMAMQSEIKSLHIAMSALGSGGWSRATQATWGRAGAALRKEYAFLAGFADDLKNGRLTEDDARNRAALYADNAYGRFWNEYSRTQASGGMKEERLIVAADERTCKICTAAAGRGWVEIGTLIIPQHLRCRCEKDYR